MANQRNFLASLTHPVVQGILLFGSAIALFFIFRPTPSGNSVATKETRSLAKKETSKAKILLTKDSQQAYPGFTIAPTMGTEEILLLNMDGRPVHTWSLDAVRARLLPNCNILVIHGSQWGKTQKPWKELRDVVREYDWNGQLVWEYKGDDLIHHDTSRTQLDSTFFIERMVVAAPLETSQQGELSNLQRPRIRSDVVREVSKDGTILWEWQAHEHLPPLSCGWRGCTKRQERYQYRSSAGIYDWTHMNTVSPLPENRWYDAGDQRFKPGNLLIMVRNLWTGYLLDKETGEIVWHYEGDHENGTKTAQGLIRGHEIHMIEKGLPGEGNLLVFDNGLQSVRPYSIIREINPQTKQTVWRYENQESFYSNASGSAQRLASGNTMISDDRSKRIFEVNPEHEIVWELELDYQIARAHRYDQEYCPNLAQLPLRG